MMVLNSETSLLEGSVTYARPDIFDRLLLVSSDRYLLQG